MVTYINIDDESSALLDKFCNADIRSTDKGALLGRIIRPWYTQAAKLWVKNPDVIDDFLKNSEPIGEKKTHAIGVRSDHARMFRETLKKVNERTKREIDETQLVSWLAKMFIEMYRIKQKTEGYKIKFGSVHRV